MAVVVATFAPEAARGEGRDLTVQGGGGANDRGGCAGGELWR